MLFDLKGLQKEEWQFKTMFGKFTYYACLFLWLSGSYFTQRYVNIRWDCFNVTLMIKFYKAKDNLRAYTMKAL